MSDVRQVTFDPDWTKLKTAAADSGPWAYEIVRLLEAVSGVSFSPNVIRPWLDLYAAQVLNERH